LKRKTSEAQAISDGTSLINLKVRATEIWQWEEKLAKGIESALGKKGLNILLGATPGIFRRLDNFTDIEGHWVWFRFVAEEEPAVGEFKKKIVGVIGYIEKLSKRTLASNFIESFDPGDLALF
jgi:hypothetical protein